MKLEEARYKLTEVGVVVPDLSRVNEVLDEIIDLSYQNGWSAGYDEGYDDKQLRRDDYGDR